MIQKIANHQHLLEHSPPPTPHQKNNLKTTESNLNLLEDLIKQVVSKVLPQIRLQTKRPIGRETKAEEPAGPISLCSQLNIEHLKTNCCLETEISGN